MNTNSTNNNNPSSSSLPLPPLSSKEQKVVGDDTAALDPSEAERYVPSKWQRTMEIEKNQRDRSPDSPEREVSPTIPENLELSHIPNKFLANYLVDGYERKKKNTNEHILHDIRPPRREREDKDEQNHRRQRSPSPVKRFHEICVAEYYRYNPKFVIPLADGRIVFQEKKNQDTIRLLNVNTGETWTASNRGSSILCFLQLADGRIVSGSDDKLIKIWTINGPTGTLKYQQTLTGHSNPVGELMRLHDKDRLVSRSETEIIIWNLSNGTIVQKLEGEHVKLALQHSHSMVALKDDRIAFVDEEMTVTIWPHSRVPLHMPLPETTDDISWGDAILVLLQDGTHLAACRGDAIRVWRIPMNSRIDGPDRFPVQMIGNTDAVTAMIQLKDGRLATGLSGGAIKIWNTRSGHLHMTLTDDKVYKYSVDSLLQLHDGRLLATYDFDKKFHCLVAFNVASGKTLQRMEISARNPHVHDLYEFSSNKRVLISHSTITVWDFSKITFSHQEEIVEKQKLAVAQRRERQAIAQKMLGVYNGEEEEGESQSENNSPHKTRQTYADFSAFKVLDKKQLKKKKATAVAVAVAAVDGDGDHHQKEEEQASHVESQQPDGDDKPDEIDDSFQQTYVIVSESIRNLHQGSSLTEHVLNSCETYPQQHVSPSGTLIAILDSLDITHEKDPTIRQQWTTEDMYGHLLHAVMVNHVNSPEEEQAIRYRFIQVVQSFCYQRQFPKLQVSATKQTSWMEWLIVQLLKGGFIEVEDVLSWADALDDEEHDDNYVPGKLQALVQLTKLLEVLRAPVEEDREPINAEDIKGLDLKNPQPCL